MATLATGLRHDDLTQAENSVVAASANWVKQPNEAMRREIEKSIVPLANESAAKWVGQAVFWSGQGSIAPAENPVVMPADFCMQRLLRVLSTPLQRYLNGPATKVTTRKCSKWHWI